MPGANEVLRIAVAKRFSTVPGPRYISQGPNSGEKFRKSILENAFSSGNRVFIDLDGTSGYGSSFLDEAFGGLVRESGFNPTDIINRIEIKSDDDPALIEDILNSIREARRGPSK